MKESFLFLTGMCLWSFGVSAQTVIPKIGTTFSNVAFQKDEGGQKRTLGWLIGAGFNFPLNTTGSFSIHPELLFIQKGFALKQSSNGDEPPYNQHLNYAEIPLLAKLTLAKNALKAYLNAGPSIAYGLGGKITGLKYIHNGPNPGSVAITYEERKVYFGESWPNDFLVWDGNAYYENRFDISLQFGGGFSYSLGPGAILLDFRYGLGLTDLQKEVKSTNNVLAIGVGYAVPLGSK